MKIDTVYQTYLYIENSISTFATYYLDIYRDFFDKRYYADSFESGKPYGIEWLTDDVIFYIRLLMLAFNLLVFNIPQYFLYNLDVSVVYFTEWGAQLTTLSLIYSIWASRRTSEGMLEYKTGAMLMT